MERTQGKAGDAPAGIQDAAEAEILGETGRMTGTAGEERSAPAAPSGVPGAGHGHSTPGSQGETRTDLVWVRDRQFVASTGSGHSVVCDARESDGGHNSAPQPLELFLTGLGNCSALDVVSILERMRVEIRDLRVSLRAPRVEATPRVWREVTLRYELSSPDASAHQLERAVRLSMETYCSASAMLQKAVPIRAEAVLNGERVAVISSSSDEP